MGWLRLTHDPSGGPCPTVLLVPTTPQQPLRRDRLHHPAVAVAGILLVLGVLVATVWSRGGFGTDAAPYLGTRVETGDVVSTRWWDVTVHDGWLDVERAEIHISITATNKQPRTDFDLTTNMLVLRLPSGEPMLRSTCTSERGSRFGPFVPAAAVCVFGYETNETPQQAIPDDGSFEVEVIVLDQKWSDDLLTDPRPVAGEPAGWMPVSIEPRAQEEA